MTRSGRHDAGAYACGVTIDVVAHRGANDEEPEHSLAAYLRAIEQGVDAIECDVRLTVDGTLVCVHDRRIDRTSTGTGPVSAMTLSELAQHDYSRSHERWFDFESPSDETRTAVLTLERLLTTMTDASTSVRFAIETKHPVRYGAYVERELADLLHRLGLDSPVDGRPPRATVMSFSRMAVRRSLRLLPQVPTVYLMDPVWRWHRDGSLPKGVGISGPSVETLREHPHYVERVHERGHRVHVWTVDDDADIDLCLELGVDAIISNRPGHVLERLGR